MISELLDNKYDISWKEVNLQNDENGRPYLKLPEQIQKRIISIDISLSHCKEYAVAYVVAILDD